MNWKFHQDELSLAQAAFQSVKTRVFALYIIATTAAHIGGGAHMDTIVQHLRADPAEGDRSITLKNTGSSASACARRRSATFAFAEAAVRKIAMRSPRPPQRHKHGFGLTYFFIRRMVAFWSMEQVAFDQHILALANWQP